MIRPELSDVEVSSLKSKAEAKFYEACKQQLDDKYLILHSISWVRKNVAGDVRDGEADFVIFDPDSGFIVIEIKGGGIRHDSLKNLWFSTDNNNIEHKIKDPFRQAVSQKNTILKFIQEHKDYKYLDGKILMGHAVFFADLDDISQFNNPKAPMEIIGGKADLTKLQEWVVKIINFYKGHTDKFEPIGKVGISIVKDVFCKDIHVKPLLKFKLEEEEEQRIKLTEEQARMLTMLGDRKKALISGGAGTGKTLLAFQRASELAAKGNRTLLICYNNLLGESLADNASEIENLEASSLFSFIARQIAKVKEMLGRDLSKEAAIAYPSSDLYDVQQPFALALAAELIDKYDAIIIDEGQDFHDSYWMGVEDFLIEDGYFYIFYDHNQRLYNKEAKFPINEAPFYLTHNCRNTSEIHAFCYLFYEGIETSAADISGGKVEFIEGINIEKQATKIHSLILNLLLEESVGCSQIKVLVNGGHQQMKHLKHLSQKPLPKPYGWKEKGSSYKIKNFSNSKEINSTIQLETIGRFKGLEADILILWGLEGLDIDRDRELFYVASSRAKSRLFIVGDEHTCVHIKSNNS